MTTNLRDQLQTTLTGTHTLERELGGGGMSKVFVAEETRLGRKVVIKVLSPELAQGISVERFEREIKTVAGLQQANIVPIHSAGDTNGLPFYTMPFVEGESLRTRLARGPLAVTEVIGVLRDVARALAYAHQRGVVHRDIKPDNVLMSGGAAVVTDFGIAKAISAARTGSGGATLTQIGTSIGTPAYMAPEQAAGDPGIDHRADIYSLGALAYELLAGQPVFAGRTPQRMLAAHMSEAPKPITEFRGDLPQALADLVMQCLAKEAADRPQGAGDIARVLESITSGSGMQSAPPVLLGGAGMFRKALAIYAAAFVAVAILAKAAIVGIGLPDWVFPGSLIVMALGLPVILWTGYVQRVARRAFTMTPTFTPGGTPSTTAHGTIATMALKAAPKMSWYRTARGGAYAMGGFIALIAAFMIMRQFGIGPFGSLIGTGALSKSNKIIITDFRVTGGDSTLGRVVSEAVRQGLSESSALTIVSPTAIAATLTRMQRPQTAKIDFALAREIGQREGAKAIIDGEVSAVSGGFILTLRLMPADSGNPLASISAAGDGPSGLIDAADKATRQLRAKVGESLRRVQGAPALAQVTTSSMEALRKYSEAYRYNSIDRNYGKSIASAREAIALDSSFAMAWRLIGAAMSNATAPASETQHALEMAYKYQDRLTERERTVMLESYYRIGGRDRTKAIQMAERLMAMGDTFVAGNNMGLVLNGRREYARSESLFAMSARADSSSPLPFSNRITALVQLGRFDDAAQAVAEGRRRFPAQMGFTNQRLVLLYNRGDMKEYDRVVDSLAASPKPADKSAAAPRLRERALRGGKLAEFQRLLAAMPSAASGAFSVADSLDVASIDVFVRDSAARAVRRLDALLATGRIKEMDPRDRPYFTLAAIYSNAGRPDKAKAMVAAHDAEVSDTMVRRVRQAAHRTAEGSIALSEKRFAEAIDLFRRGDSQPDGPVSQCTVCLAINLARTFDIAGQADSAIAAYERYLTTPYTARLQVDWDPQALPVAYWRLGNLYEAKGNAAKAAEYYRKYAELHKDADPEFQPRVKLARERLAKLAPVERPRH